MVAAMCVGLLVTEGVHAELGRQLSGCVLLLPQVSCALRFNQHPLVIPTIRCKDVLRRTGLRSWICGRRAASAAAFMARLQARTD